MPNAPSQHENGKGRCIMCGAKWPCQFAWAEARAIGKDSQNEDNKSGG